MSSYRDEIEKWMKEIEEKNPGATTGLEISSEDDEQTLRKKAEEVKKRVNAHSASGSEAQTTPVQASLKNRGVYILLLWFTFFLGGHNFYAGYFGRGVGQLVLTLIGIILLVNGNDGAGGFFIFIVFFWAFVEWIFVRKDAKGNEMV